MWSLLRSRVSDGFLPEVGASSFSRAKCDVNNPIPLRELGLNGDESDHGDGTIDAQWTDWAVVPEQNRFSLNAVHRDRSRVASLGFTAGNAKLARQVTLLSAAANDAISLEESVPAASPVSDKSSDSVHLKLGSEAMQPSDVNEKETKESPNTAVLHSYCDPQFNVSLSGFNVSKKKFQAWVGYTLQRDRPEGRGATFDPSLVTTAEIRVDNDDVRDRLRGLWRSRRLLSDRTEVLAVYKSDKESCKSDGQESKSKRGGFPDLLHIYAERLSAIIQDEIDEEKLASGESRVIGQSERDEPISEDAMAILDGGLLGWLKREYGEKETEKLCSKSMLQFPAKEQYAVLQHFLEWFRRGFPYYYDRCDTCGASAKDDPPQEEQVKEEASDIDGGDNDGTFLGYVYPSEQELIGKAGRTEIYQCHKCGSFTRFPRYNAASSVIQNKRGRCGEYSMLLFRILRATGHEARWVVDWADHVWAEVRLNKKWIHLDPCEAAVDQPLLYQGWGKQQTYIVAFHAPVPVGCTRPANLTLPTLHYANTTHLSRVPLIEDVTTRYTSDHVDVIRKRRDETSEELNQSMEKVSTHLEQKLNNLLS